VTLTRGIFLKKISKNLKKLQKPHTYTWYVVNDVSQLRLKET